ncbi:MAG: glycosyltransferase [Gemmatimonadales bacterium]|nr:MAG: glycosyltransferase [Gemmatimonadales bacterium]
MSATPRITIGLPVYNGATTLEGSMGSLLAQTFGDFELLISDNASTDATEEVVRAVATRDTRVRYVRQTENIGANGNYSYVAQVARGEYLKWASASDWCAPTFLERCLDALDGDPDAVVAAPRTRLFEDNPSNCRGYAHDIEVLDATPSARLIHLYRDMRLNNAFNGLIRLSALRQTRLVEPYLQADMVLMGHLALLGKYLLVPEPLFYRRMEPETSTSLQDADAVRRHHYPTPTVRSLFQASKRHVGWFRAALASPMSVRERAKVLTYLARHLLWERDKIGMDFTLAWRYATRRPS